MFKYQSPIGDIIIFYNKNTSYYSLKINDELYGNYSSPALAMGDVSIHHTGCDDWDKFAFKNGIIPTGLGKWIELN